MDFQVIITTLSYLSWKVTSAMVHLCPCSVCKLEMAVEEQLSLLHEHTPHPPLSPVICTHTKTPKVVALCFIISSWLECSFHILMNLLVSSLPKHYPLVCHFVLDSCHSNALVILNYSSFYVFLDFSFKPDYKTLFLTINFLPFFSLLPSSCVSFITSGDCQNPCSPPGETEALTDRHQILI